MAVILSTTLVAIVLRPRVSLQGTSDLLIYDHHVWHFFVKLYYNRMMSFEIISKRLCAALDAEAEGHSLFSKK